MSERDQAVADAPPPAPNAVSGELALGQVGSDRLRRKPRVATDTVSISPPISPLSRTNFSRFQRLSKDGPERRLLVLSPRQGVQGYDDRCGPPIGSTWSRPIMTFPLSPSPILYARPQFERAGGRHARTHAPPGCFTRVSAYAA